MKGLPSDIWHPLLFSSLNQEKDGGRGNVRFICQQGKWHSVIYASCQYLIKNMLRCV